MGMPTEDELNQRIEEIKNTRSKNLADQMQKFKSETNYDRRVNPATGK